MKVLVYSHSLQIGGSQITAINLAAAMRRRGHDVVVAGPSGPLASVASDLGVPVHELNIGGRRPSLRAANELRQLAGMIKPDLVHAYSHSACLEAFLATYALDGVPLICSERGQMVPRPFPKTVPLIVAHRPLEFEARRSGYSHVYLMRVMVDTEANNPAVEPGDFKERHGAPSGSPALVLVSRLASAVKLESIIRTIDAFGSLPETLGARLLIVGDGDARAAVQARADAVNRRLGQRRAILVGSMTDPRPAYSAADIVVGMQGSALRGMAFGKPTVIVGDRGYSEIVGPSTFPRFLEEGFSGVGDGGSDENLTRQLTMLLEDGEMRDRLGRYSRQAVCESVSLEANADILHGLYREVGDRRPRVSRRSMDLLRFVAPVLRSKLRPRRRRAAGRTLTTSPIGFARRRTSNDARTQDEERALHG
jgi:glycosyltransferase involved in cell wall biosynthesis